MVKIGNINIGEFPLILAPMEDVSDPPFRALCKAQGADLMFTEFISVEGLIRDADKSVQKLDIYDQERPIGIQIFGAEFDSMRRAAEIVEEAKPEILDIGGAVHNLASMPTVKYRGKLLILNADQFFYLKKEELFKILAPFEKSSSVLFSYSVNSSDGYNALEVGADRMVKGIIKNNDLSKEKRVETYTGISYIDLAQLKKVPGVSKFFESVCPFDQKDVRAILLDHVDYWDFGTVKRYWDTLFNILQTYRTRSTHPFLRFLIQEKAIKSWKINLQNLSYHATSPNVIIFN